MKKVVRAVVFLEYEDENTVRDYVGSELAGWHELDVETEVVEEKYSQYRAKGPIEHVIGQMLIGWERLSNFKTTNNRSEVELRVDEVEVISGED